MGIVYIDGIKTRDNISAISGKKFGIKQLCDRLGVSATIVSKICRNGYGQEDKVNEFIRKGIPFAVSAEPVPCRVKREHTKRRKYSEQIDLFESTKKAMEEALDNVNNPDLPQMVEGWLNVEDQILNLLRETAQSLIEGIDKIQKARGAE